MTVEEVSEYLRLAQSTIYKLLSEGKLPGRKIGGSWRFSRRALDEWIEVDVIRYYRNGSYGRFHRG
mgnify:CR=1 FL=1